jgi:hypothetical protein
MTRVSMSGLLLGLSIRLSLIISHFFRPVHDGVELTLGLPV